MPIYHIAYAADWQTAQEDGKYTVSTKGRSLAEQGFIHAGEADQVAPVANMIYKGDSGLVVLVIDPQLLRPELKYDPVPGWAKPFPHIYGPLNPDAVTGVRPLVADDDGTFSFEA
ncbi:MAG TPA: DUF952 domain-containing protein [Actinocrinis sp.]|jgi:glutathione S-transferase